MLKATSHALRHPAYRERYQRDKRRLGCQRAKVAQIDVARKLAAATPLRGMVCAARGST
jgi:transposase